MSVAIYLDPEKTSVFEPKEGDERKSETISPFAVPDRISVDYLARDAVSRVAFDYPGGETGDVREVLDDRDDPSVVVLTARYTNKILELRITPPADLDGIRRVAERLRLRASSVSSQSKRFSYLMIAGVMGEWASQIVSDI